MILYELFEDERHSAYRRLSADNLVRQYHSPSPPGGSRCSDS